MNHNFAKKKKKRCLKTITNKCSSLPAGTTILKLRQTVRSGIGTTTELLINLSWTGNSWQGTELKLIWSKWPILWNTNDQLYEILNCCTIYSNCSKKTSVWYRIIKWNIVFLVRRIKVISLLSLFSIKIDWFYFDTELIKKKLSQKHEC